MGLVFTYVLAWGGAAVSLVNPRIGVLVYVAFAILKPESLWSWSIQQGSGFSRVVAVALLAGWAFNKFGDWRFAQGRGVVWCLIGFCAWGVIAAACAAEVG